MDNGDSKNAAPVEHELQLFAGVDSCSTSSAENLPVVSDIKVRLL